MGYHPAQRAPNNTSHTHTHEDNEMDIKQRQLRHFSKTKLVIILTYTCVCVCVCVFATKAMILHTRRVKVNGGSVICVVVLKYVCVLKKRFKTCRITQRKFNYNVLRSSI